MFCLSLSPFLPLNHSHHNHLVSTTATSSLQHPGVDQQTPKIATLSASSTIIWNRFQIESAAKPRSRRPNHVRNCNFTCFFSRATCPQRRRVSSSSSTPSPKPPNAANCFFCLQQLLIVFLPWLDIRSGRLKRDHPLQRRGHPSHGASNL